MALAGAALEVRAALVLDVAQERGVLPVGGGAGEPANHVLEAGERALVAVVALPAQHRGGARSGPARRRWVLAGDVAQALGQLAEGGSTSPGAGAAVELAGAVLAVLALDRG